jgi:tRNA (guanine37-N1)-methyltransferase
MPMVHVHCFARDAGNLEGEVLTRASEVLGVPLHPERDEARVVKVRDVAPNKWMMCLSFRLPRDVAFAEPVAEAVSGAAVSEKGEQ